jgi:DNA mismatch repair protein MutS2
LAETGRAPVRTAYNTIDVRGRRVDDALAEVDKFLDDALRNGERVLMVIHGHGTGALRQAVRDKLADSELVDRFDAAPPEDGGNGVTVVWMG